MQIWVLGYANIKQSLKEGKISMKDIDTAVRIILRLKFEMRHFENPFVNENNVYEVISEEYKKIALEVERESITLLKNNGILPIGNNKKYLLLDLMQIMHIIY